MRQILDMAQVVTGKEITTRPLDRRAGDPAILVAEATAARDVLGWTSERSDLKTIIEDAWRWHRQRWGRTDISRMGSC